MLGVGYGYSSLREMDMTCLVTFKNGTLAVCDFDIDVPLHAFHESQLPAEVESVEILSIHAR